MKYDPTGVTLVRRLRAVAETIDGAEHPFIPYVGLHYGATGTPKIMFVGQATRGLDAEGDSKSQLAAAARWFVRDFVVAERFDRRSAFWRFVVAVTLRLLNRNHDPSYPSDQDVAWALDRIVWTNLLKIAVNGANPVGGAAQAQRDLCADILRHEMQVLAPDCVVILTNEYEGDLVWRVFGKDWKTLGDPMLNSQKNPGGYLPAFYYTIHPQGKSREIISRLTEAIVVDFSPRRPAPSP